MTLQGPGGHAPDAGGPTDDETRTNWPPPVTPPLPTPPVPPAAPGPWPPASPVPGGVWAPPPYAGGGRFAVPGAPGLEYAGALPRFVAYFLDNVLLTIISWVIQGILIAVIGTAIGLTSLLVTVLVSGLAVVVDAAYFAGMWSSAGRATLGMRLLHLQLGNGDDGRRIEMGTAIRRWAVMGSWLPALAFDPTLAGLAFMAFLAWSLVLLVTTISSPTKQGLHDRFANTAIVQPVGSSSNGMVMGCVVILAVLAALFFISIIALIFLGGQVSEILRDVGSSI